MADVAIGDVDVFAVKQEDSFLIGMMPHLDAHQIQNSGKGSVLGYRGEVLGETPGPVVKRVIVLHAEILARLGMFEEDIDAFEFDLEEVKMLGGPKEGVLAEPGVVYDKLVDGRNNRLWFSHDDCCLCPAA